MQLSFDFILIHFCHLPDISAVAGHGAWLAVLLGLKKVCSTNPTNQP